MFRPCNAGQQSRLPARVFGARIVNYADDLVICCKSNSAQKALNAMWQMMDRLKLTVNEEKTRICRVPDGEFAYALFLDSGSADNKHWGKIA